MWGLTAVVRASPFLKSVMLSGLLLGAATGAAARPSREPPPPAVPDAHVEGDEANSLTVADDRVVRLVHFDLCWPATQEEYDALGKNAVLMLTASSMFRSDLPLTSVYIQSGGARIPLQRIVEFDAQQAQATASSNRSRTTQVSFYLLPIHLAKLDARLLVDFTGDRKAFGVTSFSKEKGLDPRLPEFLTMDRDDATGKADIKALGLLLVREYPDYFPEKPANVDARTPSP